MSNIATHLFSKYGLNVYPISRGHLSESEQERWRILDIEAQNECKGDKCSICPQTTNPEIVEQTITPKLARKVGVRCRWANSSF